jgi:hypothetical protein
MISITYLLNSSVGVPVVSRPDIRVRGKKRRSRPRTSLVAIIVQRQRRAARIATGVMD